MTDHSENSELFAVNDTVGERPSRDVSTEPKHHEHNNLDEIHLVTPNSARCALDNVLKELLSKKLNQSDSDSECPQERLQSVNDIEKKSSRPSKFSVSTLSGGQKTAEFKEENVHEELITKKSKEQLNDANVQQQKEIYEEFRSIGSDDRPVSPRRVSSNASELKQSGEPGVSPSWETLCSSDGGYPISDPELGDVLGPGGMYVQTTNVNVINTVRHVAWSLRSTIKTRSTAHILQTVDEENALALLSKPCPNYNVMCRELLKYIEKNPKTADLKISLYMVASETAALIKPFPRSVVEENADGVISLNLINEEIPSVQLMGLYLSDPEQFKVSDTVVNLIHWLLVYEKEPKITYLPPQFFHSIFQKVIKGLNYQEPTHVFKLMNVRNSITECKWRALKEGKKSNFAFYGDCLKVMHSIIHLGFFPLVQTDGPHGPGIYLYTDLQHCLDNTDDEGWCWGKSELGGQLKLILVVEVLDDPQVRFYNEYKVLAGKALTNGNDSQELYCYYAPRSELVRIRYVLVYVQRQPKIGSAVIAVRPRRSSGCWLMENKKTLLILGSLLAVSVTAHHLYVNKAIRSDILLSKISSGPSPVSTS